MVASWGESLNGTAPFKGKSIRRRRGGPLKKKTPPEEKIHAWTTRTPGWISQTWKRSFGKGEGLTEETGR